MADVHFNIGNLMSGTDKPAEAMESYRPALAILRTLARDHPESSDFASRLGVTLTNIAKIDLNAKRFEEARVGLRQAIEWQGKALASYPSNPAYRDYQANNLNASSRRPEAWAIPRTRPRRSVSWRNSAIRTPRWWPSTRGWPRSSRGLNGPRTTPSGSTGAAGLRQGALCNFGPALRRGPRERPELADDRRAQHRYNAACAAARAACGQGKDDPPPDDAAKARLRRQALDWLHAELEAWRPLTLTVEPGSKEAVVKTLKNWKTDPDLAGLRDPEHLAKLPQEEREAFQRLWADVDALLAKAEDP